MNHFTRMFTFEKRCFINNSDNLTDEVNNFVFRCFIASTSCKYFLGCCAKNAR